MSTPDLVTVRDAAQRLAVSPLTIRRRIAAGKLPAVRLGGPGAPVRIRETDLQDYVDRHLVPGGAA